MENTKTDESGGLRSGALSAYIEQLLDRHGVAERQRNRVLETALDLSYAQARRRMAGEAPWTLEEIRRLAHHFQEPLVPMVAAFLLDPGTSASFAVAGSVLPCTIWTTGKPLTGRVGPLVALHDKKSGQWSVVPATECQDKPSHELKLLLFEPPPPRRIAVLDDDPDAAQAIVDFLTAKGLDAHPFSSPAPLLAAMKVRPFDGFIVDWLLGAETAQGLLSAVRTMQPTGPLIILTGQITTGAASEDDLAVAGATFRALVLEKPIRPLSLFNALQVGLAPSPEDA